MKYIYISFFLLTLLVLSGKAQEQVLSLTLDDVVGIASEKSLQAFRNENMYLASYWEYRYFKADRLPSLTLSTNPLDFNRYRRKEYNFQTNEEEFVLREYLNSDLSLSLSQKVGLTGGTIFLNSAVEMIKNLNGEKNTSYQASPVSIGFSQQLNGYNSMRWKAKIEPLKFEMAKKELIQSKEVLSINTADKFFDLVSAQIQLKIAETNLASADTLYKIGKGRFQVGTVTQDELLSLELNLLRAKQDLTKAHSVLQRSQSGLNSFLAIDKTTQINCIVPEKIPDLRVKADEAVGQAIQNNPDMISHLQQLLEEDEKVAKAKSETGFNTSIYALYGLNQSAEDFADVYNDPERSQRFQLGVSIPVLDWGKRRGRYQMAESNREVAKARIKQERIDFEQQVYQDIIEFNLQSEQVTNAALADTVAQKGYEVTLQRFLIGKVDVLKLNTARNDLETARSRYVEELRKYWNYYYRIRMWTLFDFVKGETLSAEYDKILQK
ncbi:MAG: hypothetical protein A2W90_07160 [Bacteroidetes bacterium GWF2_42_66]|nr:MAG: hypothetical protein A2W92_01500 [Bacteroidetes bacterium GWA2_42_15]OFY02917.1 MAG: hypothetical protein A2W89_24565 [Bacteroidetes bacterium GWE2_42_39]OFY44572.1 MAG: hypothetical protein A2W90_07160 [Bacteroidetes bacterium GWF2_42_66]HBL74868.1 TolC family protein [Prolixibacteraceae bacterium]HCR91717.1 TolC family protein [Prolixibacteraceae bacterium]